MYFRLPEVEACICVGRVCSDWRSAALEHRAQHHLMQRTHPPQLLLWYIQEVWALQQQQRDRTVEAALHHGQTDILASLHDTGGWAFDRETSSTLARLGHLDALQWARRHGCPWDSVTCRCTVKVQGVRAVPHGQLLWIMLPGTWQLQCCSAHLARCQHK